MRYISIVLLLWCSVAIANGPDWSQFDASVETELRKHTPDETLFFYNEVQLLQADSTTDKLYFLHFEATHTVAKTIVKQLKNTLRQKGYVIYIAESSLGLKPDVVNVLKSNDPLIGITLRFDDQELTLNDSNQQMIDVLYKWHTKLGFDVYSVSEAGIDLTFDYPLLIEEFIKDVAIKFPFVISQSGMNLKDMIAQAKKTNTLHLIWN